MLANLNIFMIPPFLSLIVGVYLAVLSLIKGRLKTENVLFAMVCIWGTMVSPVFILHHLVKDIDAIIAIERAVHFFYVFLPAISLLFFHKVLSIKRNYLVVISFILSGLLAITTQTDLYIRGLHSFSWGYIAKAGISFQVFGIYSAGAVGYYIYCFVSSLKVEENPVRRLKSKYILLSIIVGGLMTLLNIPAINGIDFYPVSNFIFVPMSIMAYGVLKYHLLDIKSMLHRTLSWLVLSSLIVVPNFLVYNFIRPYAPDIDTHLLFLLLVVLFFLNLIYIKNVQPYINKVFHKMRYNLDQVESRFNENILALKNFEDLLDEFGKTLQETLSFNSFHLYLKENIEGIFTEPGDRSITIDPDVEDWLRSEKRLIQRHLLETNPTYEKVKDKLLPYFDAQMSDYLLPLVRLEELLAVLFLPEKADFSNLSPYEARFLNNITASASIALSNTKMYQDISNLKDSLELRTRELTREIADRSRAEEEKRQLEERLQNMRKMEAIGTLAGGVAHDLNNILSGIVNYPELLLMDLPEDSAMVKSLHTIQKSGEKAAIIVQDLLTLARRGAASFKLLDLNEIVQSYLNSPEHANLVLYHSKVDIRTHLAENLHAISGSTVHLSKLIMNLISNASEAMPEGGVMTISTENRRIVEPIRGFDEVKPGNYVVLTVSDNGTGIDSKDLQRIFEPFYTKKAMGRNGSGLGMAVVWGTVKDHNGFIDIISKKNEGSTFTLYFPSAGKIASDQVPRPHHFREFMGKGELILVVDDVKEQREITTRMLEKLGYNTASAASGEEAVEYMKNHHADLLLLDMIMDPGIDGLETYKRILKLHPKQKAIIASGFSETERVKEVQRLGAGAYIKKPYLLEEIGRALRKELDKVKE
jgi:signal transduction histidine kinase/ActR/RegA family two-component response regulator